MRLRWFSPLASLRGLLALLLVLVACGPSPDEPAQRLPPLPGGDIDPAVLATLRDAWQEADRLLRTPTAPAERQQAVGELGRLFHAHGFLAESERCYESARQLAPGEFRWAYLLGLVQVAQGQPDRAVAALRAAVELQPDDLPAAVALARALQAAGRSREAVPNLDRLLGRHPQAVIVLFQRGQIAIEDGEIEVGAALFERARALQPSAGAVRTALAAAYNRLGRRPEAEAVLAAPAEQPIAFDDPLLAEVTALASGGGADLERGLRAFEAGRFTEAEAAFRRAVTAAPEQADAHLNLGSALARLGRLEEARAAFEQALHFEPKNARARFNLGTLLAGQGDDAAALVELEKALAIDAGYWEASFNAGNAALRLGRFGDCVRHFGAVLAARPARGDAHYAEAVCVTKLGRDAEARRRLEQGLGLVPNDRGMTLALARLLAASPDDAVRDGARALALAQGLAAAGIDQMTLETLAMACAETGDFAQAIVWQERALQVARAAGRLGGVPGIEAALAEYRAGRPWRRPFRGNELRASW